MHKVVTDNDRKSISVLFTVTAAGEIAPPLVLFSYQRLLNAYARKTPGGWSVGNTENGWMTSESLYEYVANVFHPWAVKKGLVSNNHFFGWPHVTYHLVQFCKEKNIELISLFPNATYFLQLLDVSFFHPLKVSWEKNDRRIQSGKWIQTFRERKFRTSSQKGS